MPERLHPPTGDQPPLERVDVDTLVGVGGNVSVLVMAGDPVPTEIAGKARRPRETKRHRK